MCRYGRVMRSPRRDRVALATWPSSNSARINARLQLDVEDLAVAQPGITPVAAVGWAVAQGLRAHPAVNRRVVLYRIRANPTVRVSFAVDLPSDLQVAVLDCADALSQREFQRQLVRSVRAARSGSGPFASVTSVMSVFPVVVARPALRLWSLVTAGLGLPILGFSAAPFGAALVSSVAAFDLTAVDVPFVPFSRCALVVSVGAARLGVVVRDGQVTVRNVIDVAVTADHRICDGAQFASFTRDVLGHCGVKVG